MTRSTILRTILNQQLIYTQSKPKTSRTFTSSTVQKPKLRFLSAWFCPYAHRATLALEHHAERIDYEWIEALGWEKKESDGTTKDGHEWWYHWKADELKRTNPSGLVPTLIPLDETTGLPDEGKSVYESLVTIDYIDNISNATGRDCLTPLDDPYQQARCRIWSEKVNRECCSPYYGVLVRTEDSERMEHFRKLLSGLRSFNDELKQTSGPTFLEGGRLSNVDVALIPWAFRYYVLEHYRGEEYRIPMDDDDDLAAYAEWFEYVFGLDSVKRTLPDKEEYLEHIGKYADASARSKVANAVRRGVAAHDLDDEKDEYRD